MGRPDKSGEIGPMMPFRMKAAARLDSYEAERLPVAADVLGISTALHDKAAGQGQDAMRRYDPRLR